jgi:hypothetical protein
VQRRTGDGICWRAVATGIGPAIGPPTVLLAEETFQIVARHGEQSRTNHR